MHRIVVVGASTGGIEALIRFFAKLPRDFPAPVFAVQHLSAHSPGHLVNMIQAKTPLRTKFGEDGEKFEPGRIYVAPPDRHMEIDTERIHLGRGPKENMVRPAVDVLFRSAARSFGPNVVGIILTGHLDDGALGLNAIKVRGGIAIAQDPQEAVASEMPANAVRVAKVDFCLPLDAIPGKVVEVVSTPSGTPPPGEEREEGPRSPSQMAAIFGPPLPFVCPECQGPLWETEGGKRFQCHVGHSYGFDSLVEANEQELEKALWSAVRAIQEQADLLRRISSRDRPGVWLERAGDKDRQAAILLQLLQQPRSPPAPSHLP